MPKSQSPTQQTQSNTSNSLFSQWCQVLGIANESEKGEKAFFYFSMGKALKFAGIVQSDEALQVPLGL